MSGPQLITRWDLDKTYLRSDFSDLGDLWRTLLERPDQKRAVPGAASLLRLLGAGPVWVHILSGSPRQMRGAILKRFAMDGVRVDQLTLKPNASNLLRLRLRALKDQLGYKLSALLEARAAELEQFGEALPEVLVGDDSEADAFVYSLYADVCSGAVDVPLLERVLTAGDTYRDVLARSLARAHDVAGRGGQAPVRILLHLDRQSPPSKFTAFGARVVPFHNYVQACLLLFAWGYVDALAVSSLCQEMLHLHRFDLDALARSYLDLERRGHIGPASLEALEPGLTDSSPELGSLSGRVRAARASLHLPQQGPGGGASPDYIALAREHRGGHGRR